ncbi:MAG: UPF0149 family protein [Xanthomonadales bacterium]|nr:UPF0149 family protein [Xanthomonadales bacterium]
MSATSISYRELSETLARLQIGINASDLHGSLTGYLCGGGKTTAEDWTEALAFDLEAARGDAVFAQVYHFCREQLDDVELAFEPLLPSDDVPLSVRADALVDWCRGFLGGVGLAGAGRPGKEMSADAREIVQDFGNIAASNLEYTGSEEDEAALAEVLEFVRVGVLLLYGELDPGPSLKTAAAPASRRLH